MTLVNNEACYFILNNHNDINKNDNLNENDGNDDNNQNYDNSNDIDDGMMTIKMMISK